MIEIYERLAYPFEEKDIEWRIQQVGTNNRGVWAAVLAYVDARAIRRRLNEVVSPENWQTHFKTVGNGVVCELSIFFDTHQQVHGGSGWVTKTDGAGETDIEGVKGGYSGAFKRAAYSWGIGEYLYDLDRAYAEVTDGGQYYWKPPKGSDKVAFHWNPPKLPKWALPGSAHTKEEVTEKDTVIDAVVDTSELRRNIESVLLDAPGSLMPSQVDWIHEKMKDADVGTLTKVWGTVSSQLKTWKETQDQEQDLDIF